MLALSGLCGWIAVRLHAMEALGAAFGSVSAVLADPHLGLPLAGAGVALAGTYLLVRLTLGFTGASR
ncbi:MAG: hypothetical protein DMF53_04605 [Acidobacteria bacterium]|nr:MAG: hypothetical protein DMF53_04605 [Acidobacteriota bacterium]